MKAVVYDHQRYECVGTEPYTRLNGTPTTLEIWQSHCVTCGHSSGSSVRHGRSSFTRTAGVLRIVVAGCG